MTLLDISVLAESLRSLSIAPCLLMLSSRVLTNCFPLFIGYASAARVSLPTNTGPCFSSDEQMQALREGLGLRKPGPEFWGPVGKHTAAIPVEDKISLLGYLVPCFGLGDPAQEEALQSFVSGLLPTYEVLKSKCPELAEEDIQLMGAELLAYELLTPGKTTREQFALWLEALEKEEIMELLDNRKSYRRAAAESLEDYIKEEAEKQTKIEELRAKMQEQKQTASMERSMIFNPRSEKLEKFDNPNKQN